MKKLITLLLVVLSAIAGSAQTTAVQIPANENPMYAGYGNFPIAFLLSTPSDAVLTLNNTAGYVGIKYPLVLFAHGIGERGTADVASRGSISQVWDLQSVPPFSLLVPGGALKDRRYSSVGKNQNTQFFFAGAQGWGGFGYFPRTYTNAMLRYIKKHYSHIIDTNRIYMTGYSWGGGHCNIVAQDPVLNPQIAAMNSICAGYNDFSGNNRIANSYKYVAESGLPYWAEHAYNDNMTDADPSDPNNRAWISDQFVQEVNKWRPYVVPKYFRYNDIAPYSNGSAASHSEAWNRVFLPSNWNINFPLKNGTIVTYSKDTFEWFLEFDTYGARVPPGRP